MEITLISKSQHERLFYIQKYYPTLTFENEGYEYLNKELFTESAEKVFWEVTQLLKDHIVGFSEFNNFKHCKKTNRLMIRFQYHWSEKFKGVGYLLLDELLNGFENN